MIRNRSTWRADDRTAAPARVPGCGAKRARRRRQARAAAGPGLALSTPDALAGTTDGVAPDDPFGGQLTLGERLADRVAAFGGSWTFILFFLAVLAAWVVLNTGILAHWHDAFDPYPYILLNLFLSMLAALQAPVIMMSQNRLAAQDRLQARHDYEVNLRAEIEIAALHDKLDACRMGDMYEALRRLEWQLGELESRDAVSKGRQRA